MSDSLIVKVFSGVVWPSSSRGIGLHTRSTSLTLSSSFHLKGLTRRCYVCSDKDYNKLAITFLNFQGSTKPINHNHTCHMGQKYSYYILLMGWGCNILLMCIEESMNKLHAWYLNLIYFSWFVHSIGCINHSSPRSLAWRPSNSSPNHWNLHILYHCFLLYRCQWWCTTFRLKYEKRATQGVKELRATP